MIGSKHRCLAASWEESREDENVTFRGSVDAWECDQMGHLNVRFYGRYFSMAEAWVFRSLPSGVTGVRIGTERMAFAAELRSGTPISIRSYKSSTETGLILHHELYDDAKDRLSASLSTAYVLDANSSPAASAAEKALSSLPIYPGSVGASGGNRWRVERKGRPPATLTGRRVLPVAGNMFADVDRETLIHLANQAVPNLGLDAYRSRDPDGSLSIGSATVGLTVTRHRSAQASEAISVFSRIAELGRRSMGLVHDLRGHDGTAIAHMEAMLVFIDLRTRRSIPIPPALVADYELV